jgi:hypothetical protein
MPCLTHRTAVDLRRRRDGWVPVDHLQAERNAALAAGDAQDCGHGNELPLVHAHRRVVVDRIGC